MSQEKSERTAKQQLADAFRKSETIQASELAAIVERDPKVVRSYLRSIAARDQSQLKNQRWELNKEQCEIAVAHFDKAKRVAASE